MHVLNISSRYHYIAYGVVIDKYRMKRYIYIPGVEVEMVGL
jgi:hypothetical protein